MNKQRTRSFKRYVVAFLKFAIPLAIIAYLVAQIEPDQWRKLRERPLGPSQWLLFALAFSCMMTAICITFTRWWLLVRALKMPFRIRDAFRLGFLAYLLNFVSVGSVGGDLFKAIFIAREQPGRRAVAAATVFVDRVVGFCGLLVVATAALLLGEIRNPTPEILAIRSLTFIAAAVAAIAILLVFFTSGYASNSLLKLAARVPKVGSTLWRLIEAGRMYRNRSGVVAACVGMSVSVHCLIAITFFFLAHALFAPAPTLAEHFMISPLACVAGSLPFTPAGLGALEAAMEYLYIRVPDAARAGVSGVTVALAYRVITIAIAMIGVVYYWTSRREVRRLLEEAEESEEAKRASLESQRDESATCTCA